VGNGRLRDQHRNQTLPAALAADSAASAASRGGVLRRDARPLRSQARAIGSSRSTAVSRAAIQSTSAPARASTTWAAR
jgi:hypothetical protein